MPPDEYIDIDGVVLNSDGFTPWWCDFDVSSLPVWGLRASKGSPFITIPHADGDLSVPTHLAAVGGSLLGAVYGDYDQDGVFVSGGLGEQRMQLAVNLAVIMDLCGGNPKPLVYHLYDVTYEGEISILDTQGATSDVTSRHPVGASAQLLAVKYSIAAGVLELSGS